jgi:hypothetical protein
MKDRAASDFSDFPIRADFSLILLFKPQKGFPQMSVA